MTDDQKSPAHKWWDELRDRNSSASRAARARLRRCGSAVEVLSEPAVHVLHARLISTGVTLEHRGETLAALAMVLAHVDSCQPRYFAAMCGASAQPDGPARVSHSRFQAMVRTQSVMDLATQIRRVLPLLDRTANVDRLIQDILYWNDKTRARWCFDYYGAENTSNTPSEETADV